MVSMPGLTPVSTPTLLMIADALLLAHVPPEPVVVYIVNEPAQTAGGPAIIPASAVTATFTVLLAVAVPQALLII